MTNRTIGSALFSSALGIALMVAGGAHAALIVDASVGGAPPTGTSYVNFDNLPLGNAGGSNGGIGVSFTSGDGAVVSGALSGKYAPPYLSNGNGALFGNPLNGVDTTPYLSTGIGSITMTFAVDQLYLGLLWGSVDNYNSLSFFDGANFVGSIAGTDVWAGANGNQGVNGTYYVNISSDLAFDTVIASSTNYAFEFDNVAYRNQSILENIPQDVPEPGTLALLCTGLAGLAGVRGLRRRRKA